MSFEEDKARLVRELEEFQAHVRNKYGMAKRAESKPSDPLTDEPGKRGSSSK